MSDGVKPTYDARKEYYEVMKLLMIGLKNASLNARYQDWHRGLWSLYNMVCPYINEVPAKNELTLKERLLSAHIEIEKLESQNKRDPALRMNYQRKRWKVEQDLLDIEEQLHRAAKNVMLPTSTDAGDMDDEEMLRRSGL